MKGKDPTTNNIMRMAQIWDEEDMRQGAIENKMDIMTYRLLRKFQDELFLQVDGLDTYIDYLKPHSDEIKKMGIAFELLGLARHVKGTAFIWKPREALHTVIDERMRPKMEQLKRTIEEMGRLDWMNLNKSRFETIVEIADLADFIVKVLSTVGLNRNLEDGWKLPRALRQLLISTSLKRPIGGAAGSTVLMFPTEKGP